MINLLSPNTFFSIEQDLYQRKFFFQYRLFRIVVGYLYHISYFKLDLCQSLHLVENESVCRSIQIRRSSYKVAYDWLGRTMKNNAILKIQYGGYGGRHDVGEKRHCTSFKFREMRTLRKEYFKF